MFFDGIFLGTMTTLGFCLMYGKLPPWVQDFMKKHPLATELVLSVGFYMVMGMTLTAHFAVGAMVLQVQALLHVARNPEKFLFLQAAKEKAMEALSGVSKRVNQINEDFKARSAMKITPVV